MNTTTHATRARPDLDADTTLELTTLNGFRFIESESFLDVEADGASLQTAARPRESDPGAYREACRRVLAPFPIARSPSAMGRARAKMDAIALSVWCGAGVAVVRAAAKAALGGLLRVGAARRRFASWLRGWLEGLGRIASRARGLVGHGRG